MAKVRQPILSEDLAEGICKALGIDPREVWRVIIDCKRDRLAMVYVEVMGSDQLLDLDWARGLSGADIRILDKPQ